jgi:hypothetical protein
MYFQYPLETLARRRASSRQLDFAREARRVLDDSDEVMFEPLDRGLAIFAAHEEALLEPRRILRDMYGDFVELREPRVRYMPGEPAHEPIMHVRIAARREYAAPLLLELRQRGARVIEQCTRDRTFIARAEAPMASLLGLPDRVAQLTEGSAMPAIRLLRYAPVPAGPDLGPQAA